LGADYGQPATVEFAITILPVKSDGQWSSGDRFRSTNAWNRPLRGELKVGMLAVELRDSVCRNESGRKGSSESMPGALIRRHDFVDFRPLRSQSERLKHHPGDPRRDGTVLEASLSVCSELLRTTWETNGNDRRLATDR
jgi:hypothetical protein